LRFGSGQAGSEAKQDVPSKQGVKELAAQFAQVCRIAQAVLQPTICIQADQRLGRDDVMKRGITTRSGYEGIDVVCLFQDMDLKDLVLLGHLFHLSWECNKESVKAVYIDIIILHP
jgi:hypothetical protein